MYKYYLKIHLFSIKSRKHDIWPVHDVWMINSKLYAKDIVLFVHAIVEEAILKWHILTYLCTMLGCYENVSQINMGNEDSHDTNIESKGDGALNIHDDAHVITYL
jgi:hypothetical protein